MSMLFVFLHRLERKNIYYKLNRIRDSVLVEVAVPGQRWEVEFFEDNHMEIEKFTSDGKLYDDKEMDVLFRDYSD
jgi:hypothetical protein